MVLIIKKGNVNGRYIRIFSILVLLLFATLTPVTVYGEEIITQLEMAEPLALDPEQTAFFHYQDSPRVITLNKENLVIFKPVNLNRWKEQDRFVAPDAGFSTFSIYDIDGDQVPEVIAGTREPGFLYIYQLTEDGKWQSRNYGKYLWSSVRSIIVGRFNGGNDIFLLVQNYDGMLFLLHKSEQSLDLVWQSPNNWRLITDFRVADFDNDQRDEIFVLYQNNGFAILKMASNSIVPVFENFPWGRILGLITGDWDQDRLPEVIFSTTQKIIYVLGFNEKEKNYRFEEENNKFSYFVERIYLTEENGRPRLLTSDSQGKLHFYELSILKRQWEEEFAIQTGRINRIYQTPDSRYWLLSNVNQRLFSLAFCPLSKLRLIYSGSELVIQPSLLTHESKHYLSLRALGKFSALGVIYNIDQQSIYMQLGEEVAELTPKPSWNIRVNGEKFTLSDQPLFINNDLYLTLTDYGRLFKREFSLDAARKALYVSSSSVNP